MLFMDSIAITHSFEVLVTMLKNDLGVDIRKKIALYLHRIFCLPLTTDHLEEDCEMIYLKNVPPSRASMLGCFW